jgi:hypothetical protein
LASATSDALLCQANVRREHQIEGITYKGRRTSA